MSTNTANLEIKIEAGDVGTLSNSFKDLKNSVEETEGGLGGMSEASEGSTTKLNQLKGGLNAAKLGAAAAAAAIAATAAAITAAAAAVVNMTMELSEQADAIAKTSAALGITTDAYQELGFAMQLSGADINTARESFNSLATKVAAASRGGTAASEIFERLGVSLRDSSGNVRNLDDMLGEIADSFSQMEDGTLKTAAAVELFGGQGAALIPMLNQGSEGIDAMRQEARDLGIVLSSETTVAAEALNDDIARLKGTFDGFRNQALAPLLPLFNELVSSAQDIITEISGTEEITAQLTTAFSELVTYVDENKEAIIKLTNDGLATINDIITVSIAIIKLLKDSFDVLLFLVRDVDTDVKALNATLGFMKTAIVSLIPGLGTAIGLFRGLKSGVELFADALERAAEAIDGSDGIGPKLVELSTKAGETADSFDGATRNVLTFGLSLVEGLNLADPAMVAARDRAIEIYTAFQNIGNADVETPSLGGGDDDDTGTVMMNQKELNAYLANKAQERIDDARAEQELINGILAEGVERRRELTEANRLEEEEAQAERLRRLEEFERERIRIREEANEELRAMQEKQQAFISNEIISGMNALTSAIINTEGESRKKRRKALKKALGRDLVAKGGALVAEGIGNVVAQNYGEGLAQISGGGVMITAGAKLGASGGKGSKSGAKTAPKEDPAPIQNNSYNQNISFGILNDRRSVSRELERVNNQSRDRGLN